MNQRSNYGNYLTYNRAFALHLSHEAKSVRDFDVIVLSGGSTILLPKSWRSY